MKANSNASGSKEYLLEIINVEKIISFYQPIVDINHGTVWGYETLSRADTDSELKDASKLFDTAEKENLLWELELLCTRKAIENFCQLKLDGKLFINVSYDCLLRSSVSITDHLLNLVRYYHFDPARIVLEITERTRTPDIAALVESAKYLHSNNFSLAIDDLGAGYSTLMLWSELRPDYVKIDRHFISGIDTDTIKTEFVRSIVEIGRNMNCKVITEGIETRGEMKSLNALGVQFMQGYFFQKPLQQPLPIILRALQKPNLSSDKYLSETLVSSTEKISSDVPITTIARYLQNNSPVSSIAIVNEDNRPIGIVHRKSLLNTLSKPFALDLYSRKTIAALYEEDVLIVERKLRLEQVSRMVTRRARFRAEEDFIIVENGYYVGIGQVIDLLRLITEIQVTSARHANPLTMLPGNVPIGDCVNELLSQHQPFVVVYYDLDNFKPFNDLYGYAKGDDVLVWLSGLLKKYCNTDSNFIGHVGGDDFIGIFSNSTDYVEALKSLLTEFDTEIRNFYNEYDRKVGGIETEDRFGQQRFFDIISISAAAIKIAEDNFDYMNFKEVSQALSKVKKQAKNHSGSLVIFADGKKILPKPVNRAGIANLASNT